MDPAAQLSHDGCHVPHCCIVREHGCHVHIYTIVVMHMGATHHNLGLVKRILMGATFRIDAL